MSAFSVLRLQASVLQSAVSVASRRGLQGQRVGSKLRGSCPDSASRGERSRVRTIERWITRVEDFGPDGRRRSEIVMSLSLSWHK